MNHGKQLEQLLETTHHEYRIKKIADVCKVPETWQFTTERDYQNLLKRCPSMVAKTGDRKCLVRTSSDVDFVGSLANGKTIKFDAKNVSNGVSIPLSRFTKDQVESGVKCQKFRGFGGFIVHFEKQKRAFWIDANEVRKLQDSALFKKGKKSINISEFKEEIKVENRKIDWLGLEKFR